MVYDDDQRETADLIAGKGEGSIFLLHGPPGVDLVEDLVGLDVPILGQTGLLLRTEPVS